MDIINLKYLAVKIKSKNKNGDVKIKTGIFVRDSNHKTAIVVPGDLTGSSITMALHYKVGEYIATIEEFPVNVKFESVPEYGASVCLTEEMEKAFYNAIGANLYYYFLDETKIISSKNTENTAPAC